MNAARILPLAAAAALFACLTASPGQALPAAPASTAVLLDHAGLAEQAKWKQKHAKRKHWDRGRHYGWSRGRGHKYGLRKQSRYR